MSVSRRDFLTSAGALSLAAACSPSSALTKRMESAMIVKRSLGRVRTLPAPAQGQFGPDHRVIEVIRPDEWVDADPFILLMDDRIDGHFVGGPHPHTGMETVSFLVSGTLGSENGLSRLSPGDVEWTTTGKGIIHGKSTNDELHFRLLQLWVTLPKAERWAEPDHQFVRVDEALVRREPGAQVKLYSGSTGALRSPTRNHVPVTLVEMQLEPGASIEQELPLNYNGFFYVLEGTARIGEDERALTVGQVGWLDRHQGAGMGSIRVANGGSQPLRVLMYAGERQNIPIVQHGPFVGDTREDIVRAYQGYRSGTFRVI